MDSAAVVFADGADAIVSNGAHHAVRALGLARRGAGKGKGGGGGGGGSGGRVVLSAECNSWPRCYKAEYEVRHTGLDPQTSSQTPDRSTTHTFEPRL